MHVAHVGGEDKCTQGSGGETLRKERTSKTYTQMRDNITLGVKQDGRVWNSLIWLRRGTSGGGM